MSFCIFNQQRHRADRTQNTATWLSRVHWAQHKLSIMERKNTYEYVHVGLLVRYCSRFNNGDTIERVLDGLDTLNNSLEDVGFNVSVKFLDYLRQEIRKKTKELKATDKLPAGIFSNYKSEIDSLENTIYAEAS